jgi:hypothetical protein
MIMADVSLPLTHVTSAAIVVWGINKLKSASWFPFLQKNWTIVNRTFSVVAAFGVSIGISYQWSANASGGHQLVLQIPGLAALVLSLWHVLNQYVLQETLFQVTKPGQQQAKAVIEDAKGN